MSKFAPVNENELIEYAKIQLGQGAITINVTPDQARVRLRQAFDLFNEYHYSATEKTFIAQQLTQEDQDRGFVITPEAVINVTRVLSFDGSYKSDSDLLWFPGGMNPMSGWIDSGISGGFGNLDPGVGPYGVSGGITLYLMDLQKANYESILYPEDVARYNEHTHRLYPQVSRKKLVPGLFLVYEAYSVLEKLNVPSVYNNNWLKEYYTALLGMQWGNNLTKELDPTFGTNTTRINGQGILDRYTRLEERLRKEVMDQYSTPPMMVIG